MLGQRMPFKKGLKVMKGLLQLTLVEFPQVTVSERELIRKRIIHPLCEYDFIGSLTLT
jgi:hypothetical protein